MAHAHAEVPKGERSKHFRPHSKNMRTLERSLNEYFQPPQPATD